MRKATLWFAVLLTAVLLSGCILSDELTTVTIQPDGSADIVIFHSNIHSTEMGVKAEEELRRYVEEFDTHKNHDYVHITQVHGQIVEARWIRKELPYSDFVSGTLPNATALENFYSIEGKEGELQLKSHFSRAGVRRKLSTVLVPQRDFKAPEPSTPARKEVREKQANGISATRFVIASGHIIASQGFTVASDKRSALFDPDEIEDLLRTHPERAEIFLEWEVDGT